MDKSANHIRKKRMDQFASKHVKPTEGRTLIVGSKVYPGREDRRKAYTHALGVDALPGEGVDVVRDLEEDNSDLGLFRHIECWSVLEHAKNPWVLANRLETMLEIGGSLHLTVPFIWRPHAYPNDYWRFTRQGVLLLFPRISWVSLSAVGAKLKEDADYAQGITGPEGALYLARTEIVGFGLRWK